MFHDYCLKFRDSDEAEPVLFQALEVEDDAGTQRLRINRYDAIDVIGIIRRPTGVMIDSPEGPVPEMAPIDGWHVNVRHRLPAPELEPFAVQVANPIRRWA